MPKESVFENKDEEKNNLTVRLSSSKTDSKQKHPVRLSCLN
jgi:hypothetical protein